MKASLSSPDSIPSLSALSSASTDPDDNVSRVLFRSPKTADQVENASQQHEYSLSASSNASTRSLPTSSNGSDSSEDRITHETSPRSTGLAGPLPSKEREVPILPSCHGGLNLSPTELANIFAIFNESNQKWPPKAEQETSPCRKSSPGSVADSGTDAVTTVTSNIGPAKSWERKVDSLERECVTLKEIIKADAVNMVGLKSQIKSLRTHKSATFPEVAKVKSELAEVQREKELLLERDAQHVETIKILKDEVNTLSKLHFDSNSKDKEISQLRLENQLFAAQIVENESEIQEMRQLIDMMQKEMKDRCQGEQPNSGDASPGQVLDVSGVRTAVRDPPNGTADAFPKPLEQVVASLSMRLEAIERDRQPHVSPEPTTPTMEAQSSGIEVEGEGFEVSPNGQVEGADKKNTPFQEKQSVKIEKSTRSMFCDCLLSSRAIEE